MINNETYNNFVIAALGWLGDTLLTGGLCRSIKKHNPDAHITFVCLKTFEDAAKLIEAADEIITFDKSKGLRAYAEFAHKFKNKVKADAVIITHPHERSIIAAVLTGAHEIVSLPLKCPFNPLNLFISKKRKYIETEIKNTYKNDYNSGYLELLGIESAHEKFKLKLPDEYNSIEKFNLPEKYIVLAPVSKNKIKDWDYENLSQFIKYSPLPAVLTGTSKAADTAEKLKREGLKFIDLCGKTSIIELAAVIKNAAAAVSVDTGAMHLAYGLGVNTICLFFSTQKLKSYLPCSYENIKLISSSKISFEEVLKHLDLSGAASEKV